MKCSRILLFAYFLFSGVCSFAQDPGKWEADIKRFEASDSLSAVNDGLVLFVGSSSVTKWTDIKGISRHTRS